jgi:hypothetical protein
MIPHLPPPAQAEPAAIVAVVAEVRGTASIGHGEILGTGHLVPASRWIALRQGAQLSLLQIPSGEEWGFRGPCRFQFDASGRPHGAIPLTRKRITLLQGEYRLDGMELAQGALVLRRGGDLGSLGMRPRGPMVMEPRPTFTWAPPVAGVEYRFRLQDASGRLVLNQAAREPRVSLPEPFALQEGATYTLVIEGPDKKGEPAAWSGAIQLLEPRTRTFLAEHQPTAGASPAVQMAFELLCLQKGM